MQVAPPEFDRMFGALADHTRRDIVRRAITAEEGIVELASRYSMSFAAVQKHIAILERAGLVTKERVGAASSSAPTSSGCASCVACSISTRGCGAAASTASPSSSLKRGPRTNDRHGRPPERNDCDRESEPNEGSAIPRL
jgi:hypothetical protein